MAAVPEGGSWVDWHRAYDDPGTDLSARLRAVQRRIAAVLESRPDGPIRVLSVCAGQGRDLLGVLAGHARRADVRARLVELDPVNAGAARAVASAAGLEGVEVVTGDASWTSAYAGMAPADLVLVCGVFGHVTDEDIRHTVRRLPGLCAGDATVIWTRGGFEPDLRPAIRRWFVQDGFAEVAFDSGGRIGWGVGTNRMVVASRPFEPDVRLFTFLDAARGPARW